MNAQSAYRNPTKINPNIKTAIIYSLDELFAYIVEIKEGNKSYYISSKDEPLKFGNMADAREAALKEDAKEAYLALSKTSEETDLRTYPTNQNRYDYSPVALHAEK